MLSLRARGAKHPTAPLPDTIVRNEIATAALVRPRDDIRDEIATAALSLRARGAKQSRYDRSQPETMRAQRGNRHAGDAGGS